MSQHEMMFRCNKCNGEFWVPIEWYSKDGLIRMAKNQKCPHCGSDSWSMTDACER